MQVKKNKAKNNISKRTPYTLVIKRLLDIICSLVGFVISLPFILLTSLLIIIDSPGSPIFLHERIGCRGEVFRVVKLRTMITRTHYDNGEKIRDRDRVTKLGRLIRRLSLDELPQFVNIIKGDMSFVGPRPLHVRYYPYYTHEELHRHDVRPGITGLAQINGRGNLQWEERFKYDLLYVKELSFRLDIRIIVATIVKVFKREGTSTIRNPDLVDFDIHRAGQERVD